MGSYNAMVIYEVIKAIGTYKAVWVEGWGWELEFLKNISILGFTFRA